MTGRRATPAAVTRTRISKDPLVRREELLNIALDLCRTHGFDSLRVEQIVQSAGIAKGTFYHYFAAKDDVLRAIVERFGDALFDQLSEAALIVGTPVQRLQAIMVAAAEFKNSHHDLSYASYLYRDGNLVLRHQIFHTWRARASEVLTPIITDGLADGSFTAVDAEAATDIVLLLWFDAAEQLLNRALKCGAATPFAEVMTVGAQEIYQAQERVLGVPSGTFDVPITDEIIELTKQLYATLNRTQP